MTRIHHSANKKLYYDKENDKLFERNELTIRYFMVGTSEFVGITQEEVPSVYKGKPWQLLTPRIGERVRLNEQQTFRRWW